MCVCVRAKHKPQKHKHQRAGICWGALSGQIDRRNNGWRRARVKKKGGPIVLCSVAARVIVHWRELTVTVSAIAAASILSLWMEATRAK